MPDARLKLTKLVELWKNDKSISKEYHKWVIDQPCFATGSFQVAKPHHHRMAGWCGMGQKPADIFELPITYEIHTAIHSLGTRQFERIL